jgi:hypothetical protein
MKWIGRLGGLGVGFALVVGLALADGPLPPGGGPSSCVPPRIVLPPGCGIPQMQTPGLGAPGQAPQGATPEGMTPQMPGAPGAASNIPGSDAFARAPEGGTQPSADVPGVMGDLIGVFGGRIILVPRGATPPAAAHGAAPFRALNGNVSAVVAPLPLRTGFKISENESARPVDRVFFDYNYYSNVDRVISGPGVGQANFQREMLGFEKTFAGGDASFGMRLPFRQLNGDQGVEDRHLDDVSLIFKYALVNDRTTGNVFSAGMVLTLPTGDALQIDGESSINSTVFQPYVGYIYHMGDFYLQGFTAFAVPTDARDVTLFFNSVSLGYHLYRRNGPESWLTGIIPVAELHLNTPLNHRGLESTPIGFSDSLNFTGGAYFQFRRATLGLAVCTPLTGPRPYDYEVATNLSFRF